MPKMRQTEHEEIKKPKIRHRMVTPQTFNYSIK